VIYVSGLNVAVSVEQLKDVGRRIVEASSMILADRSSARTHKTFVAGRGVRFALGKRTLEALIGKSVKGHHRTLTDAYRAPFA
jgi:hypothetical protein